MQNRYSKTNLSKRIKLEPTLININDFSIFILIEILSHTGFKMFCKLNTVCKKWNKALHSDFYYRAILIDHCKVRTFNFKIKWDNYILINEKIKEKTWKEIFESKKIFIESNKNYCLCTKYIAPDSFYEGEIENGKLNGYGALYKKSIGLVYIGYFSDGKPSGKGKRYWPSGDYYEGDFNNCKRNGKGILYFKNLGVYDGEFLNDLRSGSGIMKFTNGDIYDGQWKNDMTNGKGKFYSRSNYNYDGDWVDNQRSGYGILKYKGGTYEGEWKNNKAHGKGVVKLSNGSVYNGELFENMWQGKGILTFHDGKIYNGSFKGGKMDGFGEIICPNHGCSYKGFFKNGKFHGHGELIFNSKHKYVGKMKQGKRNGNGILYDENNKKYFEGEFDDDKIIGKGIFFLNSLPLYAIFNDGIIIKVLENKHNISTKNIGKIDNKLTENKLILGQHSLNEYIDEDK